MVGKRTPLGSDGAATIAAVGQADARRHGDGRLVAVDDQPAGWLAGGPGGSPGGLRAGHLRGQRLYRDLRRQWPWHASPGSGWRPEPHPHDPRSDLQPCRIRSDRCLLSCSLRAGTTSRRPTTAARAISSAGYLVVGVDSPGSSSYFPGTPYDDHAGADIGNNTVDLSAALDNVEAGPLGGRVDRWAVAAVGHSNGGSAVANLALNDAYVSNRFNAYVVLSGGVPCRPGARARSGLATMAPCSS